MKESIKNIIAFISLLALFAIPLYFIFAIEHHRCAPDPNAAGCGRYSQYDLDNKWCQENGGHYFSGGIFGGSNCVIPK